MLAQNFKSAAELRLTDPELSALQKTLVLLETGKLIHAVPDEAPCQTRSFTGHFNMAWWDLEVGCGTICCIGGTAELIGGLQQDSLDRRSSLNPELNNLFYPGIERPLGGVSLMSITPEQAATALRSYLTTGDARWDLAVA